MFVDVPVGVTLGDELAVLVGLLVDVGVRVFERVGVGLSVGAEVEVFVNEGVGSTGTLAKARSSLALNARSYRRTSSISPLNVFPQGSFPTKTSRSGLVSTLRSDAGCRDAL